MGIFDRKQKGEVEDIQREGYFEANVEEVSLSAARQPRDRGEGVARKAEAPAAPQSNYGIDRAIALMRAIPISEANLAQVVSVIKATLESTNVSVPRIIEDAHRKLRNLEAEMQLLRDDIANYESEIAKRNAQIEALTADHGETTTVMQRLELAESQAQAVPAAPSPANPAESPAPTSSPAASTAEDETVSADSGGAT
ncbi:MAG: hypothetical protein KDA41_10435 [Planctomycetales bacterium]|nr:hypothetical protein [Planctomycetales bacterium]